MREKLEALMRLRLMRYQFRLDNKKVEENYKEGKLMITLASGEVLFIDDESLGDTFTDILAEFNAKYPNNHVYHMLELGGPLLAVMYVGSTMDDWESERIDDDGYCTCYVYNALAPYCSEFGDVHITESTLDPYSYFWDD